LKRSRAEAARSPIGSRPIDDGDLPGSGRRYPAADREVQFHEIDLAVAAEALGADGAYFRVHHFARQLASPFPLQRGVLVKAVGQRAVLHCMRTAGLVLGLVFRFRGLRGIYVSHGSRDSRSNINCSASSNQRPSAPCGEGYFVLAREWRLWRGLRSFPRRLP
jgi:hypothetical protein